MLREGFGEILYVISVVVGNTYSKNTKMGARIHRTVALRRDCECMKLENISAPEYLEVIFFCSIFYWHNVVGGVVITTKVKYGGTMRLRMYAINDFIGAENIYW